MKTEALYRKALTYAIIYKMFMNTCKKTDEIETIV